MWVESIGGGEKGSVWVIWGLGGSICGGVEMFVGLLRL